MAGWGSDLGPRLCRHQADLDDGIVVERATCDLPEGHHGDHHDCRLGLEWPVNVDVVIVG